MTPQQNAARQTWAELLRRWDRLDEARGPERDALHETACGDTDWFALLRLAQCAYPERPRIGYSLTLADKGQAQETIRLGQAVFFHHPATTLADLTRRGPREAEDAGLQSPGSPHAADLRSSGPEAGAPDAWIYCYPLGLFGPHGPLPLHLTEFTHQRLRQHDAAFFAFCNVLVHRFLCFFFRAWSEGRKELSLDRPRSSSASHQDHAQKDIGRHGEEWWELMTGALIGCGLDSLRSGDRVPEPARLFYSGRLLQPTRNNDGLRAILSDYFMLPARIIEFQPRALPIPKAVRWTLGSNKTQGYLGWSTLVGASLVDHQSGFRIRLGPLSLSQFEAMLPHTDGFGQLHDWVRFYCGKETDPNLAEDLECAWDAQLVLRACEVPPVVLGQSGRLGWTTWLFPNPPEPSRGEMSDLDDLVLVPSSIPFEAEILPDQPGEN